MSDRMTSALTAVLCPVKNYLNLYVTQAMETAGKYVDNMVKNPTEEKFRSINVENAAFQRLVGSKPGGMNMMLALGFTETDGKLTMQDFDVKWLEVAAAELQTAGKRMTFY